jgi:hypothetical protein
MIVETLNGQRVSVPKKYNNLNLPVLLNDAKERYLNYIQRHRLNVELFRKSFDSNISKVISSCHADDVTGVLVIQKERSGIVSYTCLDFDGKLIKCKKSLFEGCQRKREYRRNV